MAAQRPDKVYRRTQRVALPLFAESDRKRNVLERIMGTDDTNERLRKKLAKLRSQDRKLTLFGAGPPFGHGYEVNRIRPEQLAAKETELGIALPEEYKSWLLAEGSGAGPDYGLFAMEKVFPPPYYDESGTGGDVETGADITPAHIAALHGKWASNPKNSSLAISINSDKHLLIISESGCGAYTCLVTHGPMHGKVFGLVSELTDPSTAISALMPEGVFSWSGGVAGRGELTVDPANVFGFYEWYENWLDRALSGAPR